MKRFAYAFTLAVALLLAAANPVLAAPPAMTKTYKLDNAHTRVLFFISHLGFMKMPGTFYGVDGTLTFNTGNNESSSVDVTIDAKKMTVNHAVLDGKLQGKEFFNTDKYPTITFKSTNVEKTGIDTGVITGNLTFLGTTRPVKLDVKFYNRGWNKFMGKEVIGFAATGKIRRSDFGMKAYLPDVGDDVELRIELEADEVRDMGDAITGGLNK